VSRATRLILAITAAAVLAGCSAGTAHPAASRHRCHRIRVPRRPCTDYWFYAHRRWAFDLVLSNPDAVKLYRLSPQQYVVAVGCDH
jgi:hypothetical protein